MNYTELFEASFATADREDTETQIQYDNFLRYTEAKMNRKLHTMKMTSRVNISTVSGKEYYGLPADYSGMREVMVEGINPIDGISRMITAQYRTPSQMNEIANSDNRHAYRNDGVYYNVINDQLRIQPSQENNTLQVIYYKHVPALTSLLDTNWISDESPDCYLYGLLSQISAFNKDQDAAAMWSAEFDKVLAEIDFDDFDSRWNSSEPLQVRAS